MLGGISLAAENLSKNEAYAQHEVAKREGELLLKETLELLGAMVSHTKIIPTADNVLCLIDEAVIKLAKATYVSDESGIPMDIEQLHGQLNLIEGEGSPAVTTLYEICNASDNEEKIIIGLPSNSLTPRFDATCAVPKDNKTAANNALSETVSSLEKMKM